MTMTSASTAQRLFSTQLNYPYTPTHHYLCVNPGHHEVSNQGVYSLGRCFLVGPLAALL